MQSLTRIFFHFLLTSHCMHCGQDVVILTMKLLMMQMMIVNDADDDDDDCGKRCREKRGLTLR